jgi:hypothetical protein
MEIKDYAAIAAIIFGLLGFAMSCITLYRSIRSDGKTRVLAQHQERQDALGLVLEAKVATLEEIRRWERVLRENRIRGTINIEPGDDAKAIELINALNDKFMIRQESAEDQVSLHNEILAKLEVLRSTLLIALPEKYSDSFAKVLRSTREALPTLGSKPMEAASAKLLDQVTESFEHDAKGRALVDTFRQQRKTATSPAETQ